MAGEGVWNIGNYDNERKRKKKLPKKLSRFRCPYLLAFRSTMTDPQDFGLAKII